MNRIVFHLNSLERGGAERVVTNLAGQFVANGYEVYIATEWQGEDEYVIDKRIKRVHVGLTEKQEKLGRISKFLARIFNLPTYGLMDVKLNHGLTTGSKYLNQVMCSISYRF